MKIWTLLLTAAAVACSGPVLQLDNGDSFLLEKPWILSHEGGEEKLPASVPSTVAGTLEQAGLLGEGVLEGKRYALLDKSRFDDPWIYSTTLAVKPQQGQHYQLVFNGLNYYADISFNGEKLATSDTTFGVFRTRPYDVTALMKEQNALEVRLKRAQPGDLNLGFVDWNPRPLDESMGIVQPVSFHATGAVSIEDVYVIPDLDVSTLTRADLSVRVRLRNLEDRPLEGTLEIDLGTEGTASIPYSLPAMGAKTLTLGPEDASILHLDHPRIWWSHDLGTPELYTMDVRVRDGNRLSDRKEVSFGVRKIESRLVGNNYRQFTLNGKDILLKGAGWTDDIFLRDTAESIERQVEYVRDMHLNCIRFENIWGKDDTVYNLCDRLGVLALVGWSCQWEWENYCGLPELGKYGCINGKEVEDLAVAYFQDQVVRLHNHPAIIGWLTGSDRIPNPGLEKRYLEIYEAEDYRPYVCSAGNLQSLAGWSGTKMMGPYEYVGPDYWYSGEAKGGAFGFNTETGIGANLPQLESLRRMIPEEELWPLSDTWDYHCTVSQEAMHSTQILQEAVAGIYGGCSSLEDFVAKAHALDYAGTRGMFEAFRLKMPGTTGIIQWMLNSAWPSLYWQLYDYYGVPTAGYYGTRKACEPEQLLFNYADRKVYAVSESLQERELLATVQVFDAQSRLVERQERRFLSAYRQVLPLFDLAAWDGKPHFVSLTLETADGKPVADNFYSLAAEDNRYSWDKTNWYYTPIETYNNLSFVFPGEKAQVELTVEPGPEGFTVTLINHSPVIACQNILKAVDDKGELVVPACWSDNFFPLLPGQTKTVTCRVKGENISVRLDN